MNIAISKKDVSLYSASEVIEYLEDKGYSFEAMESTPAIYTTQYIYVDHNENEIAFQRINNPILGILYSWNNADINDEWAEIKNTYENDTLEKERQFSNYEKWLKDLGLTTKQLTSALDYYDSVLADYKEISVD